MKIPWVPVTSGAGSYGPSLPTKAFMNYYVTPGSEVSHKAFMNLPMNTEAPPVIVPPAGAKHGSKVRQLDTGVGYDDRFKANPVPGNYVEIIAKLDALREQNKRELDDSRDNYTTLLQLAENNYRNIGRSADQQTENSIRDRLRQAGASDDEIEVILKEARVERLKKASAIQLSQEEIFLNSLLKGVKPSAPMVSAFDTNVYNFGTPQPLQAGMNNKVAEPGNEIFAGGASAGVNPPGLPRVVGGRGRSAPLGAGPRSIFEPKITEFFPKKK